VALHRVTTTSGATHPDNVVDPHKLLRDVVSETPVLHSWALSEAVGGPVYLKCENLQRAGSFKIRGLLQDRYPVLEVHPITGAGEMLCPVVARINSDL
jgi:threonine dehydratase